MGKTAVRFAFLILLLSVFQHCCFAASELTPDDVHSLLINAAGLIDDAETQISYIQGIANQIQPCPCPEEGTDQCSDAKSAANSAISILNSDVSVAKQEIYNAAQDYANGKPPEDVLARLGTAISLVGAGIARAQEIQALIPDSCMDENGLDLCSYGKGAVEQSISKVYSSYSSVNSKYNALKGKAPAAPTQDEIDYKNKNDDLVSVYPNLDRGKQLRDTIISLQQNGASQQDLSGARMELYSIEKKAEDTYQSVLADPRYKKDFWANWDYATLKRNQGDFESAAKYYSTAMASSNVDAATKQQFMDKLRADQLAALNMNKAPPQTSSFMKEMGGDLKGAYEKAGAAASSSFDYFKTGASAALAWAGQAYNDVKQFRDVVTGKELEKSAQTAGN